MSYAQLGSSDSPQHRPDAFACDVSKNGDEIVVGVRGEIDIDTAPAVDQAVRQAIEGGSAAVVLDFSAVTFIDSTGLRITLQCVKEAGEHGTAFSIRRGPDAVMRPFALTGLDRELPFVD